MSLQEWAVERLEGIKEQPRILVRDPLRLLPPNDSGLNRFGQQNGYVVIVADTNLVFRRLYQEALDETPASKVLLIDRSPQRWHDHPARHVPPPPFYPDFLEQVPPVARIDVDLHRYLCDLTGDGKWPRQVNDDQMARLIAAHLDGVLQAYRNLHNDNPGRFTDGDLQTIVVFAALGIPDAAFKKLDADSYWKIGLVGHGALAAVENLPVIDLIHRELARAPAPFRWLVDRDPDQVLRAFYLATILAQHLPNWKLLIANVDPALLPFADIDPDILTQAAPKLVAYDRRQAEQDLADLEESLDPAALQLLLIDQMHVQTPDGFATAIEKERYSTLVRSLALVAALDNLLSPQPNTAAHERIAHVLFGADGESTVRFVDQRASLPWAQLKEAYRLATELQDLLSALKGFMRTLKLAKPEALTFAFFREAWNGRRLNRLEYNLSALQRLMDLRDFLPRPEDKLPSVFANRLPQIAHRVDTLAGEVQAQLDEINIRFQETVARDYALWTRQDGDVYLTAQFLRRCLKAHWDPQKEKGVLLIFDGMRYDIWDEWLRPALLERMELLQDYAGCSLLPSETHITRKAISAGTFPDEFSENAAEDRLLEAGLAHTFGAGIKVEVQSPPGGGVGETVRYRAGNLDVYIFELCDKELHKIAVKTLPDGRTVPARPLSFVYDQTIKNVIDTEVMAIVRALAANTKVFIIADHGFGRVARSPLFLEEDWLNEPDDCMYLNARLPGTLKALGATGKIRDHVIEFPIQALRLPATEEAFDKRTRQSVQKQFASIIFPKPGYAFKRPKDAFNPNAYSHGGISIQELVIPMAALKVKAHEQGLLGLDPITGPAQIVEGEAVEFTLRVYRTQAGAAVPDDVRVDVEASYGREGEPVALPAQVLLVPPQGATICYPVCIKPEQVTIEERRAGGTQRTLTIVVTYREGRRMVRRSQAATFTVQLNSERITRLVGNLGSILGLTPKSTRG